MLSQEIIAITAMFATAFAASGMPTSDFTNNGGFQAAQITQPLFYFASGSCYPQDGEVNGAQTNGNAQDDCIISGLASGCQYQIPWSGSSNTQGHQVATYYSVTHCSGDNTYRILYDLYFRHDSGHESDWEWATVVYRQASDQSWYSDAVILEQDGNHPWYSWNSLETFNDNNDMFNGGSGQNANHPRIYVDKYHHSMWPSSYTGNKNNCAVLPQYRFRANDFYMFNLQDGNLAPISRINGNWGYGKATNPHSTTNDICSY